MAKPMYLHGREGTPYGTKGSYMRLRLLSGAHAPAMPATSSHPDAFNASYEIARNMLLQLQQQQDAPNIIVGSSFGGAVLMKLVQEGHWKGPSIFLAPAALKESIRAEYNLPLWDSLPKGHRAIIIHSPSDSLVLYQDAVAIMNNSRERNQEDNVIELWDAEEGDPDGEGKGNPRLTEITKNGMLKRALEQLLGESVEERSMQEFLDLRAQDPKMS